MSMKEMLQFEQSITNPAGIEWVIGSGADVGADLYMVAPVGSASVPSPSALYELDPTTGEATILGALGVVDPTDIAWDKDGSMMYLIDNDSDALYTVRQIQAPSTTLRGAESYRPNAGDLYYNGGNFADAFMRWDNPSWTHDDDDCEEEVIDCSTYEHDLQIERRWFTGIPTPAFRDYCTTWSDLPDYYDDCPTEVPEAYDESRDPHGETKVVLSFGTFKAPDIVAGREYYGYWIFHHQKGERALTEVALYGQEGEYAYRPQESPLCPPSISSDLIPPSVRIRPTKNIWCIFQIEDHQTLLAPNGTTWTWTYGDSSYERYDR